MKKVKSILQIKLRYFNLLCFLLFGGFGMAFSQEVSGNLQYQTNQEIKLLGYNGFKTIELAESIIDASGNFTLLYKDYKGMGYLETSDNNKLFIVINEPNIIINGTNLNEPDSIKFTNSTENQFFNQYAVEHNQREKALAGWKYIFTQPFCNSYVYMYIETKTQEYWMLQNNS